MQNLTEPHVSIATINNIIHHNVQATSPHISIVVKFSGSYRVPDILHINQ